MNIIPDFVKSMFGMKAAIQVDATSIHAGQLSPNGQTFWTYNFDHFELPGSGGNSAFLACAGRLMLGFSEAPLRVLKDGEIDNEHPIRRILAQPNPWMSEKRFQLVKKLHQIMTGTCMIHKLRNKQGQMVGLYPYSGNVLKPVYDSETGSLLHYLTPRSKEVPANDVILCPWFFPSSANITFGRSPFEELKSELAVDSELQQFLFNYLKNDGVPGTVFTTALSLTETVFKQMKAGLIEQVTGKKKGSPILLDNGGTATRIGSNIKELALDEVRKNPEARIAAVLGVPIEITGLVTGIASSTYANKEQASRDFTNLTLVPHWAFDADDMELGLLPEIPESQRNGISIHHDLSRVASLQESENEKQARARENYKAGLITLNEARKIIGQEEAEQSTPVNELRSTVGGAQALQSLQIAAYTGQISREAALAAARLVFGFDAADAESLIPDAQEGAANASEPEKGVNTQGVQKKSVKSDSEEEFTEEKAIAFFKKFDEPATDAAEKLKKAIAKSFAALEIIVIRNATKGMKAGEANDLFDADSFSLELVKSAEPGLEEYIPIVIELSVEGLDGAGETDFSKRIGGLVDISTAKISESSETVKKELQELIKKNKDLTAKELAEKIKEKFSQYKESRAQMIARTTITRATGATQDTVHKDLGYVSVWVTQRDDNVRESHKALDGKVIADGAWPGNLNKASEDINCRCVLRARKKGKE